jgi:predicted nucleotidyltransferase component of viral defense system
MLDFIHNDPEFKELLSIVSSQKGVDITLVEKDYWIMHTLDGLNVQGIEFELKGGTSLSKGYGIIDRFSEDIDIHIKTNFGLQIEGKEDDEKVRNDRKVFPEFSDKNIDRKSEMRAGKALRYLGFEKKQKRINGQTKNIIKMRKS